MKKSKYRELYHLNEKNNKREKSTTNVEKKEKRGFNVFFELKDDKKKSSDE